VHGDASSSPSAKPDIPSAEAEQPLSVSSLEFKGAAGEEVSIHLSDGSFFLLHSEVFVPAGISVGSIITPEARTLLLERSEEVHARLRALSLLSRAAQTRRGLSRKLSARGFSASAVRHAVSRVAELGYLDDRAFAESWVQSRLSTRREGAQSLQRGLLGRGVARQVAEEVIGGLYPFERELDAARQLSDGLSPNAAIRTLTGRGFRSRVIAAVLREIRRTGGREGEG
jgi:regulatory protein